MLSNNSVNNSEPIKSKKSKFLSYFENTEKINTVAYSAFFGMCLVCIILVFTITKVSLAPKPIYYISANGAGFSSPNIIPKGSITSFASSWLMNWTNFNQYTVEEVYERSKKYMAPDLLSKSRNIMDKEIADIKKSLISSMFSTVGEPELIQNEYGISVVIKGEHNLFMGKSKIKVSDTKYTISLQNVPPTETNPYGLLIKDVLKEETVKERKNEL